ncbi:MAG TPA: flagellin [Symbiobacteriaceae bacterium]|nr:flagellin [Symbiobacteriaceae bacterium]
MRINTNMSALNAWRNMTVNSNNMSKALEKLSSGYRVNRGADDAAGLAVSEKMRSAIRGTNMAIRNSQDGISMVQTAEGALNETQSILQRMRELAVQSSTGTLENSDRLLLQEEFEQLQSEITRIANNTKFNGKALLDGTAGLSASSDSTYTTNISGGSSTVAATYAFTSIDAATAATVYMANASSGAAGSQGAAFANSGDTFDVAQTITVNGYAYSVTTATTAQSFVNMVNANSDKTGVSATFDTDEVKFTQASVGSKYSIEVSTTATAAMAFSTTNNGGYGTAALGTLADVGNDANGTLAGHTVVGNGNSLTVMDGAAKGLSFDVDSTSSGVAANITVASNGTVNIQTGSEASVTLSVSFSSMTAAALDVDTTDIDVETASAATSAITALDTALDTVSEERARLGALQNRLEYTVSNLSTTSENLSAAESRVRDVDMASEMANFTKYQILQQASTAMLAQANQSTQGILSLLR